MLAARNITRVDLLKIDVEGAELDVLRGCGSAWPMIRRVVVETDRRAGRSDAVVALLVDRGLRITSCKPPRIAEDGEVQFKSPGMFAGYYREPDKTAEALTDDGYVRTGDAGYIEPDGQLKIIDRAKDVGKLASGQLFAPTYIEKKLKFFPNINEAVA